MPETRSIGAGRRVPNLLQPNRKPIERYTIRISFSPSYASPPHCIFNDIERIAGFRAPDVFDFAKPNPAVA